MINQKHLKSFISILLGNVVAGHKHYGRALDQSYFLIFAKNDKGKMTLLLIVYLWFYLIKWEWHQPRFLERDFYNWILYTLAWDNSSRRLHNNKINHKQSQLLIWNRSVEIENCVTRFLDQFCFLNNLYSYNSSSTNFYSLSIFYGIK